MRGLVITADDAGRELASSQEIAALLAESRITATTLIPVADDAEAALELVGAHLPRVHATFTSEGGSPAWSPLSGGASLTGGDGRFSYDPFEFANRATTQDVATELAAQYDWFVARGVTPTGLDSHSGTLYGLHGNSFMEVTLRFCAAHGLAFRLPRTAQSYWGATLPEPFAAGHQMAVDAADALGVALPAAMVTNRLSAAEVGSYEGLRDHYLMLLDLLPADGTSELFLHPAPASVGLPTREWELRLLRDDRFQAAVDDSFDRVSDWVAR